MARYLESCYLNLNIQPTVLFLRAVPRITPLVDIFRIPANCNGRALSNTGNYGKDSAEGVCCDLMIGQGPLRARLEGTVVTCSRRIKRMDKAQNRVDIFGASAVVFVDICKNILATPIALQEAKDLGSLAYTTSTSLTNLSCKGVSLYQSTMLDCCGEKRRACRYFRVSPFPSRQEPEP